MVSSLRAYRVSGRGRGILEMRGGQYRFSSHQPTISVITLIFPLAIAMTFYSAQVSQTLICTGLRLPLTTSSRLNIEGVVLERTGYRTRWKSPTVTCHLFSPGIVARFAKEGTRALSLRYRVRTSLHRQLSSSSTINSGFFHLPTPSSRGASNGVKHDSMKPRLPSFRQ